MIARAMIDHRNIAVLYNCEKTGVFLGVGGGCLCWVGGDQPPALQPCKHGSLAHPGSDLGDSGWS